MSDTPTKRTAGYTVAPALLAVIEKLRQGTIAGPVDRDLLIRIGVKESLVKRTLNSLKTLELITADGTPTARFETLINARPDEYQEAFAAFLRDAYKPIFEVLDPATATGDELKNAFWGYEPRGQIDAMIRLFLALCSEAGIVTTRPKVSEARDRSTDASRSKGAAKRAGGSGPAQTPPPPPPPPQNPPVVSDPVAEAKARYINLLLDKADAADDVDGELFDRIERALGVGDP